MDFWKLIYENVEKKRLLLKPGPGPWNPWPMKNLDSEKPKISLGLKNMSDFREFSFKNTMCAMWFVV